MRKDHFTKIKLPEGVNIREEGNEIIVKGKEGENRKIFNLKNITIKQEGNEIKIGQKRSTKNEKKMINTLTAHIKNMIKGVEVQYRYRLKICASHFPITVEVKGNQGIIKNFIGENIPRKVKIPTGVKVDVDREIITITSTDKELAGQAAANFEKTTWIRDRDRRVFQDGIFIIEKAVREEKE